jgi:hypothetical protein
VRFSQSLNLSRLGEDGLHDVAIAIWRELTFWDDEEEE